MQDRPALIALLGLMSLCGLLITIVVYISPNPTPALHAQILTALVGIFVAAGYAFIRRAAGNPRGTRKPPETGHSTNL